MNTIETGPSNNARDSEVWSGPGRTSGSIAAAPDTAM